MTLGYYLQGGGMILGPLLLELGTHPVSAAATSGLLVLGSSGSAVLEVWPLPNWHPVCWRSGHCPIGTLCAGGLATAQLAPCVLEVWPLPNWHPVCWRSGPCPIGNLCESCG